MNTLFIVIISIVLVIVSLSVAYAVVMSNILSRRNQKKKKLAEFVNDFSKSVGNKKYTQVPRIKVPEDVDLTDAATLQRYNEILGTRQM
jgi:hypothetical protein